MEKDGFYQDTGTQGEIIKSAYFGTEHYNIVYPSFNKSNTGFILNS